MSCRSESTQSSQFFYSKSKALNKNNRCVRAFVCWNPYSNLKHRLPQFDLHHTVETPLFQRISKSPFIFYSVRIKLIVWIIVCSTLDCSDKKYSFHDIAASTVPPCKQSVSNSICNAGKAVVLLPRRAIIMALLHAAQSVPCVDNYEKFHSNMRISSRSIINCDRYNSITFLNGLFFYYWRSLRNKASTHTQKLLTKVVEL